MMSTKRPLLLLFCCCFLRGLEFNLVQGNLLGSTIDTPTFDDPEYKAALEEWSHTDLDCQEAYAGKKNETFFYTYSFVLTNTDDNNVTDVDEVFKCVLGCVFVNGGFVKDTNQRFNKSAAERAARILDIKYPGASGDFKHRVWPKCNKDFDDTCPAAFEFWRCMMKTTSYRSFRIDYLRYLKQEFLERVVNNSK